MKDEVLDRQSWCRRMREPSGDAINQRVSQRERFVTMAPLGSGLGGWEGVKGRQARERGWAPNTADGFVISSLVDKALQRSVDHNYNTSTHTADGEPWHKGGCRQRLNPRTARGRRPMVRFCFK